MGLVVPKPFENPCAGDWHPACSAPSAMDPLTSTAAAGMRARLEALDLTANNLANAATPGFKADREVYSLYLGEDSLDAALAGTGAAQVYAPVLERHKTDPRQGVLLETSNPADMALSGSGYFLVEGSEGYMLTRAGRLQVASDGRLVTPEGREFVTVEATRIRADPAQPVEVDRDGTVLQNGVPLGRLRVVEASLDETSKKEGLYFLLDKAAVAGLQPARAVVYQGRVESSNVSAAETGVRLVQILRQFEALQRAIQLGGEMSRRAVEDVARVNP